MLRRYREEDTFGKIIAFVADDPDAPIASGWIGIPLEPVRDQVCVLSGLADKPAIPLEGEGVGDHALEYMTGGLAVILGTTGRNLGAGMSGGTAYVYRLDESQVNRDALATGELQLGELGSGDAEILRDLLEQHVAETGSALAKAMLDDFDNEISHFVRVLPRDYAAVLQTRQDAVDQGLDPDGDIVWSRILEVTGG